VRGRGPLAGIRVVELAGLGPVPHAGMVLADLGADVLRIDRPGAVPMAPPGPVDRGRRAVALDLGHPDGAAAALTLAAAADVLVEGFRPGVMERLGLGPDRLLARNPRLVYARMTGWGQDGPLAGAAGHDLNYLALTGALAAIGPAGGAPLPPLNLVADYGGGSMLVLVGVLAALVERARSGRGQVVDAAMVDGVSSLLALTYGLLSAGLWREERGANLLDGGAPYYRTYRCADGGYVAVAALEDRFWGELVAAVRLDLTGIADRTRPADWPLLGERLAAAFATRTRDEWAKAFAGVDACVTPVLTLGEAAAHPQLGGRGAVTADGRRPGGSGSASGLAPGSAPRFSRTPAVPGEPPRPVGADTRAALLDWGFAADVVDALLTSGAAEQA
jgi:alpha-methylacyl-CoA racemase